MDLTSSVLVLQQVHFSASNLFTIHLDHGKSFRKPEAALYHHTFNPSNWYLLWLTADHPDLKHRKAVAIPTLAISDALTKDARIQHGNSLPRATNPVADHYPIWWVVLYPSSPIALYPSSPIVLVSEHFALSAHCLKWRSQLSLTNLLQCKKVFASQVYSS